jgi:hypothetical protein
VCRSLINKKKVRVFGMIRSSNGVRLVSSHLIRDACISVCSLTLSLALHDLYFKFSLANFRYMKDCSIGNWILEFGLFPELSEEDMGLLIPTAACYQIHQFAVQVYIYIYIYITYLASLHYWFISLYIFDYCPFHVYHFQYHCQDPIMK